MERNELYPIFLKASQLKFLVIGGGHVALEKLTFLLKSSPNASVKVVSKEFLPAIQNLANRFQIELINGVFEMVDLIDADLVIVATDDHEENVRVWRAAKRERVLVNVADTPQYCDFYLGGIVTKGNVKVAISTNGKSPTTAKRLRQYFEETLPDELDEMVRYLNEHRNSIKGDFEEKVKQLNELTKTLIEN